MEESRYFQFCRTSKCSYSAKEAVKAKLKQPADWKKFDVYDEVEDLGQEKITGKWIVVKKENVVAKKVLMQDGLPEDFGRKEK